MKLLIKSNIEQLQGYVVLCREVVDTSCLSMFKKLSRTCFNFESAPDGLTVGLDDSCGTLPTETIYSVL